MFDDKRSRKVVLVAHCILNQNARINGCGLFPGAMGEAARVLVDSGVGILQMPCPELLHLGLDRARHRAPGTCIREALLTDEGRATCRRHIGPLLYQVGEYLKHGFEVLGVVGIDGSPGCGVDLMWDIHKKDDVPGTGGFITVLREELAAAGLGRLPIIGVRDGEWDEGVARIQALLDSAPGGPATDAARSRG